MMKNKTLDIKIKRLAGALLAFAGVACLPYIWNLDGKSLIISNSWFGVFLWGVLWYLTDRSLADNVSLGGRKTETGGKREEGQLEERRPRERRQVLAAGLSAFFCSSCLAFGTSLEQRENVVFGNGMMWLSIAVWAAIFTLGFVKDGNCWRRGIPTKTGQQEQET